MASSQKSFEATLKYDHEHAITHAAVILGDLNHSQALRVTSPPLASAFKHLTRKFRTE